MKQKPGGQVRLISVMLSLMIIIVAFMSINNVVRPIRSLYLRETSDLRRLAYNILNDMASTGVFEKLILSKQYVRELIANGEPYNCSLGEPAWTGELRAFLATAIPPGLVFTVEVGYYKVLPGGGIEYVPLHCSPISFGNVSFVEAESVTYTYVSMYPPEETRSTILRIDLTLGYEG